MWQVLREELQPKGLEIVTVALDARGAVVARPWIEKAAARHPSLVDESHQQVVALLQQHRSKLDSLATALLEHETLDEKDAYAAAGVPRAATSGADSYSAAARSGTDT